MLGCTQRRIAATVSLAFLLVCGSVAVARTASIKISDLQAVGAFVTESSLNGKEAVQVRKDPAVTADDEPTYAKLKDVQFKDGTITLKVLSRLLDDAPDHARGFIGIAFRINDDDSRFECIYVRPLNSQVDDQLRRNRSTQYFSYPDFKFDRLRRESPGVYESYAPLAMNDWIDLRIVVKGTQAKLYVDDAEEPVLVVNDLKHGAEASGGVGLWVDIGTEGYFSDVKIENN